MACGENHTSLLLCPHGAWGVHNCRRVESAGILCGPLPVVSVPDAPLAAAPSNRRPPVLPIEDLNERGDTVIVVVVLAIIVVAGVVISYLGYRCCDLFCLACPYLLTIYVL